MSNKGYSQKKKLYAAFIETRANTNHVFMNYLEWTKDNLLHNQNRIEQMFRHYYIGNSFESFNELKNAISNDSFSSERPQAIQGSLDL